MAKIDVKHLADLYRRAKSSEDKYVLSNAEAAIEAAKDMEAALSRLTVAEAIAEEVMGLQE